MVKVEFHSDFISDDLGNESLSTLGTVIYKLLKISLRGLFESSHAFVDVTALIEQCERIESIRLLADCLSQRVQKGLVLVWIGFENSEQTEHTLIQEGKSVSERHDCEELVSGKGR